MRIGLFGGTFDPVHVGHLILAERCRADAGLDEVWFLPSYRPPHKPDGAVSAFADRCAMVSAAVAGVPGFRVEPIESELPPPSYTAHTLAALRTRHPTDEFHLVIGADSLADLPQWYEPRQVVAQAGVIVVPRPGVELWPAEKLADALKVPRSVIRLQVVDCPLVDVASRDLRKRVAEGKSIRFLVPKEVETIIRERKLYK
jgi:nicotinate-nucleotide adenylyltransferase